MVYTKDTFKTLFQSEFNLPNWQLLLRDYFNGDKIRVSPESLDEESDDREGYFLGSTTTADHYKLGFFYYKMKDGSVLRRKVGLRNLIKPYLKYGFDAALAVFDDGKNWRLSLICDLDNEATNTKRFTYVFGDERALYKTPVLRFFGLRNDTDKFLSIREAFSVDALSDDFFDEYRKQYAEFVKFLTGKEYVKSRGKWVEMVVGEPDAQFFSSFGENEKMVRDYIKKMMGRIVFLYFLQSKGWLAGNLHYMHDLFYSASDTVKDDFLDKVLEPMFFGLLNTKPEDRANAPLVNGVGVKFIPQAESIPYINGGLFQQEDIDEVNSRFPANMFKNLFDFFDSYNFTIDENDPNDAEVGVDPEMLGKIFENLLEDNKDKGAFYTPKEIVRYMCHESLIAYLQTGIDDEEEKKHIANFVKTYNVEELGGVFSELALSIDQKLKDVKICDPAIGSGAFPMGLLRELYGCRKAIEIFDADNAADIKRHIIQNNIYGVDIEKGAVDIARLRFWLALIIDEKEPMPLPNLDFKIMQGNSLLESYKGVDLNMTSKKVKTGKVTKKTSGVLSLGFEETDIQKTIQDLVKSYFSITDHALRAQRRKEIDKYVKDYIKICAEGNHEIQAAVDELEIPNDQFFLWHTYFHDVFENGGFDIVIGNPPYINIENLENEIKKSLFRVFATCSGRTDIYIGFIEMATKLLSQNGVATFIIPYSYTNQNYAESSRIMLVDNYSVDELLDTSNYMVFENANVKNITIRFSNKKSSYTNIKIANSDIDFKQSKFEESAIETNKFKLLKGCRFETNGAIKLLKIKDKIDNVSFKLSTIFSVAYGVRVNSKTDKNKPKRYYIHDEYKDGYKAFVEGRYIHRYNHKQCGWLDYKPKEHYNAMYPELFENEKIISINVVSDRLRFSYDNSHLYDSHTVLNCVNIKYLRKASHISAKKAVENGNMNLALKYSTKLILGILNSKFINWYFFSFMSEGLHFYPDDAKNLPIPNVTCDISNQIETLVNNILKKRSIENELGISVLENQIDFLVYHLYDLTYDEVLIVDQNPPFTREQYELGEYEG